MITTQLHAEYLTQSILHKTIKSSLVNLNRMHLNGKKASEETLSFVYGAVEGRKASALEEECLTYQLEKH